VALVQQEAQEVLRLPVMARPNLLAEQGVTVRTTGVAVAVAVLLLQMQMAIQEHPEPPVLL